jgi:hypothetical protein
MNEVKWRLERDLRGIANVAASPRQPGLLRVSVRSRQKRRVSGETKSYATDAIRDECQSLVPSKAHAAMLEAFAHLEQQRRNEFKDVIIPP